MALYLGRVGRKLLSYTVSHPRLDRAVDSFSNAAQRILGSSRFTPRLTRDMFLLSQRVREGQVIEIRKDGFYEEGEKLTSNPVGSCFPYPVTIKLDSYAPEQLADFARCVRKLVTVYQMRIHPNPKRDALLMLLEKVKSVEELKEWTREIGAAISGYKRRFGDPNNIYADSISRLIIGKVKSVNEARAVNALILDYSQRIGNPRGYVLHALPQLLEKGKPVEELREWDREAKAHILDYRSKLGDPNGYVINGLPHLLERARLPMEVRVWGEEIINLILDHSKRFGNPENYREGTLYGLLNKIGSAAEIREWGREVETIILDYNERFGNPEPYIESILGWLLEKAKSIEELREWDREAKALVLDYSRRFDDLGDYFTFGLTLLLEKVKSVKGLKEVRALVLDCINRFGNPTKYIEDTLSELMEKMESDEELKMACEIARELMAASINPSPLTAVLEATKERAILYETHRKEFLSFCKRSGPNLANNVAFFGDLTPENAGELFAEAMKYFQAMRTSLFLPLLFNEFKNRDVKGREKLAEEFRSYYSAQVQGKSVAAPEFSPEIIEEINYSLVGSASLTREAYRRTLKESKGVAIPPPNFNQKITLRLQKAQKKGIITDEEVEFLKDRITWLEKALEMEEETDAVDRAIREFPATDREGRKPSQAHTLKFLQLHLLRAYQSNPDLKVKIDDLIRRKKSIGPADLEVIERLIEIFREIKPEAQAEVRKRIDGMVDVPRLEKIEGRFKRQRSEGTVTIELIPAKTELDYFYGYMGENCTSGHPEELLNPRFTPLRIVVNGRIIGSIHTLTLEIDGKKTLVLPGIEPKESLLAEVDAEEFTEEVIKGIIEGICKPNGYVQLCLSTQEVSQSNRPSVVKTMQRIIEEKPTITQNIQTTFPQKMDYSIQTLAVVWSNN